MKLDYFRKGLPGPPWPRHLFRAISIDETGLVLGAGTRLARMDKSGRRLALDADHERVLALLSITYRRPVSPETLEPNEAAATYWERGEKALAAFRLSGVDLPPLDHPDDAYRLGLAEILLDQGMSPLDLLEELGLDASAPDLDKYDPDQPLVPAGNGRESGRWGPAGGGGTDKAPASPFRTREWEPNAESPVSPPEPSPRILYVATDGPLKPGGIQVVPMTGIDPLDPRGLNIGPPSVEELQAINDTVNTIVSGTVEAIEALEPHDYKNYPNRETGAVLPPGISGYTTYYIRSPGQPPGKLRVIMDKSGQIYYTNNHYKSFYPVDIKIGEKK